MSLELVVNSDQGAVELALLKDKKLVELHKETNGENSFCVGDIYLGKVRKVVPSLNAAFVDVGYEKDAFLHYLDLGPQYNTMNNYIQRSLRKENNTSNVSKFKIEPDINKEGKINEVISQGQQIAVQIAKEPISTKGPRLSSEITLAGRYIVLVPFSNKVSISQRIQDEEERKRLKRLMTSIKPKNFGIIIRTVAENKKVAELDQDLKDLVDKWDQLFKALRTAKPPKRLLGELNKTSTILRDTLNADFTNIHVNDERLTDEIKEFISTISPGREKIVKHHNKKSNIFESHGINRQIKASFGRQVNMPSGAYLIIEHTEAMHVVDVNSGNRKSSKLTQETNALETNMEAATELARVLRLRDMGGIIAVDFIDMGKREHQKKLYDHMRECMKTDKAKHSIIPPSKFGVVEITRQRVRPETLIKTNETCPTCKGTGEVQASVLILDEIENNIRYISEQGDKYIKIKSHIFVSSFINQGFFSNLRKKWSKKYNLKIEVEGTTSYMLLEYNLYDQKGDLITI